MQWTMDNGQWQKAEGRRQKAEGRRQSAMSKEQKSSITRIIGQKLSLIGGWVCYLADGGSLSIVHCPLSIALVHCPLSIAKGGE